jgi:hypothetical protein
MHQFSNLMNYGNFEQRTFASRRDYVPARFPSRIRSFAKTTYRKAKTLSRLRMARQYILWLPGACQCGFGCKLRGSTLMTLLIPRSLLLYT